VLRKECRKPPARAGDPHLYGSRRRVQDEGNLIERQPARETEEQSLAIGPRERAHRGQDKRQFSAILVRLFNARLVASHAAERVERRHQGAPGDGAAGAAFRNGEHIRVGRLGRPVTTPPDDQGGERLLRDIFGGSATTGPRQRVRDQPRRKRLGNRIELHISNEPAARVR